MVTGLRVLRIIFGVIGVWQIIGLFPVLTWINNPKAITLEMAVGILFKGVIAVVCVGAYYWLGRLKSRRAPRQEKIGDAAMVGIVLVGGICVAVVAALLIPSGTKPASSQSVISNNAIETIQSAKVTSASSYDARGWTQESTGTDIIDPYQPAPPAGTRFCRDAQGIIYRVYPPGVRPELPPANPFCVGDSTDHL